MNCWARSVSECCSTQSREHYITKGLFSDKMLYVDGIPFLNGESKLIAKSKLTKKCLCEKHNNQLSPYDSEAIKFAKSLEYALNLSLKRRHSRCKRFSIHKKFIDNDKFCRWFIKTYLGCVDFFLYPPRIREDFLAKLVFSNESIIRHIKLTIEMECREDFDIRQEVSIAPVFLETETVGMEVELYGIRIRGVFSDKPEYSQKPIKIKFCEYKQGTSCIIHFK